MCLQGNLVHNSTIKKENFISLAQNESKYLLPVIIFLYF